MTADRPEDPHQHWNVKLRLAIDADNADEAGAIAEQVWRTMEVSTTSARTTTHLSHMCRNRFVMAVL